VAIARRGWSGRTRESRARLTIRRFLAGRTLQRAGSRDNEMKCDETWELVAWSSRRERCYLMGPSPTGGQALEYFPDSAFLTIVVVYYMITALHGDKAFENHTLPLLKYQYQPHNPLPCANIRAFLCSSIILEPNTACTVDMIS
jgi:hypothetical protein